MAQRYLDQELSPVQMNEAIKEIEMLDSVAGQVMRIRVEQLSK